MKKICYLILLFCLVILPVKAEEVTKYSQSAVLMELSTGRLLYEYEATKELAPASMTKVMSLILIMDAIEEGKLSYNDDVVISDNASSMGGSQVYLNTGESYKVEALIKSIAVASANDAVVAMAEKVSGSVEEFVKAMNAKCQKLGCKNTSFINPHGLDAEGHYTSAYDMALMSRYLILNHEEILNYTSIYEDYLKRPDGSQTWLINTNKVVFKFYNTIFEQ